MKKLIALLLCLLMAVSLCACGSSAEAPAKNTAPAEAQLTLTDTPETFAGEQEKALPEAQEYLDLGERYLLELNYTDSIAAYTEAIDIVPSVEAYEGRANACAGRGMYGDGVVPYAEELAVPATREEDFASAFADLQEIISLNPSAEADYQYRLLALQNTDTGVYEDEEGNAWDVWGHQLIQRFFDSSGALTGYQVVVYANAEQYYSQGSYDENGTETAFAYDEYDENGNLVYGCGVYESKTGSFCYDRYVYNELGQRTEDTVILPETGVIDFRLEYEFDESGNQTVERKYSAENELKCIWTYTYDESGHLVTRDETDTQGNLTSHEEYTYDEQGRVTEYTSTDGNGNLGWRMVYTYDENGVCTCTQYTSSGDVLVTTVGW